MHDIAHMLKQQWRRLWQLPGTILGGLARPAPSTRRETADSGMGATRALFWKGVRDGRREAAERVAADRS
jgi:hypothetical protein